MFRLYICFHVLNVLFACVFSNTDTVSWLVQIKSYVIPIATSESDLWLFIHASDLLPSLPTPLPYIYRSIKINLKMSIDVWSTLPIFLPIYLHGSLQCHAQLTYPLTFIKLHVHSHNYFPNASTSTCRLNVSVHFYNWHSSNTHTHSFNYFSSQQIGNTNIYTYLRIMET